MKLRNKSRLQLLSLEDRVTPALGISFIGGNLTVTGSSVAAMTITGKGGTAIQVKDGATNYGTYAVTGKLSLNLTSHLDTIEVDLAGQSLGGTLTIDLGRGDPNLVTPHPVSIFGGTVGNVVLRGGNGAESWNIGKQTGSVALTVNGDVNVTGKTTSPGVGEIFNIVAGSKVAGSLYANSIDNVGIGGDFIPALATVGGQVLVTNQATALSTVFSNYGVVNGSATVVGNNFDDVVVVSNAGNGGGIIGGNLTAVLGNGTAFGDFVTVSTGALVAGNLTVVSGSGSDFALIGGTIAGSTSFNLGNGNNFTSIDGSIFGGFNQNSGGGDDLAFLNAGSFIGGNVAFNLGHGANSFTQDALSSVGGSRLDYLGGGGVDTVVINGSNIFSLYLALGAGADSFEYGATASVGSANLDFGVDADADTYTQGPAVITWNQSIVNYP